jgi:hypothetical protein
MRADARRNPPTPEVQPPKFNPLKDPINAYVDMNNAARKDDMNTTRQDEGQDPVPPVTVRSSHPPFHRISQMCVPPRRSLLLMKTATLSESVYNPSKEHPCG